LTPTPTTPTPNAAKTAATRALRENRDPAIAALNNRFQRTGQLPRVVGSSPLAGAIGTGTNDPNDTPPGITITRATGTTRFPGVNRRGLPPRPPTTGRRRGPTAAQPPLPGGIKLVQPGPGRRGGLRRYGPFITSSPLTSPSIGSSPPPPPALTPNVPPPSHWELAARAAMTTNKQGLVKYPIIFKGTLMSLLYEEFDARSGHNPPPGGWKGSEEDEKRWKEVRDGNLRGVEFEEWNLSWLLRMAQMKGVEVDMSGPARGEAALADEVTWQLEGVKKAEAEVAKKAGEEQKDGIRWTRFVGNDREIKTFIYVDEEKDTLEDIKKKVVRVLRPTLVNIEEREVSLWLSAVTWGTKPSRLVRFAGRNAERDDGYWLGLYVYRLEHGGSDERRKIEWHERELRRKQGA
ncbi:hypothetical protein V495_08513, partial [Pseudogymnoascus sp. VKM F-4514 (FW-929)]